VANDETRTGARLRDAAGEVRLTPVRSGARPAPPLSRYLVALVAVAIAPLLIVASALIWRQGDDQRAATETALQSTAQALSVAIDRQLASYRLMLEALAESDLIDHDDLSAFHAYAKRVADAQGAAFVSMFEPGGRQLISTNLPYGAPLPDPFNLPPQPVTDRPPVGDVSSLRRVLELGQPSYSDLYFGLAAQRLLFSVDVPVLRGGKVVYGLRAGLPPERVSSLLASDPNLQKVHAMVVDRQGFIVGRWDESDRYTGVRVPPGTLRLIEGGAMGSAFTRTLEGAYAFRSYVRSPLSGWTMLVSIDADDMRRIEVQTWVLWGSAALAALLLSLGAATWLARGLDRSIGGLARAASDDLPPPEGGLASLELDRLRDALLAAKESRDAALRSRESALRAEARRIEAEAANQEKDRFMAAVVHELRTPLSALGNAAALVSAGKADERVAGIVQRQVGQLARLADDLLESSRQRFGKFRLQLAPVDLRDVVRQAVEAISTRYRDRKHSVRLELAAQAATVNGDAARLTQIVANLVDNALKFTPPGGDVMVGLEVRDGQAVLTVVDSGRGIDPEFLPGIFERFTQAAGAPGAGGGLGLGLAVARDLVRAHGGDIEVASEGRGRGARFTVRLPLAGREG